jgi:hypothetical protein
MDAEIAAARAVKNGRTDVVTVADACDLWIERTLMTYTHEHCPDAHHQHGNE